MTIAPTATNAGAAPAADASAASSPATQTQASPGPQSTQARALASIERRRTEAEQAAGTAADDTSRSAAQQQAAAGGEDDAGERSGSEGGKGEEKTTKEPDTIPLPAFKERIGRLNEKVKGLQTQLAAKDLEAKKATKAAELLQETLNEIRRQHAEGATFDERDDQILQHQLEEKGRQILATLTKEHEETLRRQTAEIAEEQQREHLKQTFASAINGALAAAPLCSRIELIAALKAEAGKKNRASAEQLAKVIHEKRLAEARRAIGTDETRTAPSSVRQPGPRSVTRFPNTQKGIEDWIAASRSQ
jgi:hypothetical protein